MKIPYVRGKDSETGQTVDGFYFEFPSTTYCFSEDYEREPKVELVPCIMSHRMTDWGMPNEPTICKPVDKSTLKIIGYIDTDNNYYIPSKYFNNNDESNIAKWIFDDYTAKFGNPYRCSNCNEEFNDTYKYCPNCGSCMQ